MAGYKQSVIFYQFSLTEFYFKLRIGVGEPCNSVVTGEFKLESYRNIKGLFDLFYLEMLRVSYRINCFLRTETYHQESKVEFVLHSAGRKTLPTFLSIPIYVVQSITQIFNNTKPVNFNYALTLINTEFKSFIISASECDASNPAAIQCRDRNNEEMVAIYIKEVSYKFLSCATTEHSQNYDVYFQPFTITVWIFVIFLYGAVAVTLCHKYGIHNALIWLIMIIFEQAIRLSQKIKNFRAIWFAFIFSALVLINAYRGRIILELTAPALKPNLKKNGRRDSTRVQNFDARESV